MLKKLLLATVLLAAAGCKIEISVPEGGAVSSEFGTYRVEAGESSSIEVNDLTFHEIFTAEPAEGYIFSGWSKQNFGLCGGSLAPCEFFTSWMAGSDGLIALLESDDAVYLAPTFLPSDQIRLYAVGDSVDFSGTMVEQSEFEAQVTTEVTARLEIESATDTLAGQTVMAAQLDVTGPIEEELISRTMLFWQEPNGAFYNLTDEYGNNYRDSVTDTVGLSLIPAPLVPFASSEVQFNVMLEGQGDTLLSTGTRTIEIGEAQTLSVPLASITAYPVTITDSWTYLAAFDDFRRDERLEREQVLWISQAKGIIKASVVQRSYSNIGKLKNSVTVDLTATRANF